MRIEELLKNIEPIEVKGSVNTNITQLEIDSRNVIEGSMFFAVKGTQTDSHIFIDDVINKGAKAIVCSTLPNNLDKNTTYILVKDTQQTIGYIASNFYDHPSEKLSLIGVTGTNGKTSTTTMLYKLFTNMGNTCGLISTIENIIGTQHYSSTHTTPNAIKLNELLHKMVEEGCTYCFMEVSSHAIAQGRINGLSYKIGAFTNITHDHLDYHKTFENYLNTKKQFFDQLPSFAFALTNSDDKNGKVMLQNTKASKYTYAIKNNADFKCKILECDINGLLLKIGDNEAWFPLVGKFNAYNLLTVYSIAFLLGKKEQEIVVALSSVSRVNGRFEVYRSNNKITAIIDYAHTPDALLNVLDTINDIRTKNEQLITVVGCGGNRDSTKRPIMGQIAAKHSDKTIFTSDNPRNEDPNTIIEEMLKGVEPLDYKKVIKITDRYEAIKAAFIFSKPNDIILIAGKGHETYQEINNVKHPFDDRIIITEIFNQTNS